MGASTGATTPSGRQTDAGFRHDKKGARVPRRGLDAKSHGSKPRGSSGPAREVVLGQTQPTGIESSRAGGNLRLAPQLRLKMPKGGALRDGMAARARRSRRLDTIGFPGGPSSGGGSGHTRPAGACLAVRSGLAAARQNRAGASGRAGARNAGSRLGGPPKEAARPAISAEACGVRVRLSAGR